MNGDGYSTYCKDCDNKIAKIRNQKTKNKNLKWREEFPNKPKVSKKRCYDCGKTKSIENFSLTISNTDDYSSQCKLCRQKQYENNKELYSDNAKKNYIKNKDKIIAKSIFYKQMHYFGVTSRRKYIEATNKELANLFKKQKGYCAISGIKLTRDNISCDHKKPRSKGGSLKIDNLRFIHRYINLCMSNGENESVILKEFKAIVKAYDKFQK
ncbi:MAG TPA: HNH endonuclease signature motif containing protein [Victivallales bacterium]|nr:HNH endonuclease signature motif containing protein [Victivallales bacterium]